MGRKLTEEEFWLAFKDVLFSDEKIEDAEEEVEKIIRLGNLESGCRVLDMPCGIGRHTSVFEKKGFEVTGVENTQNYAKDAENRVEDSEIINQDMKEFKRENKFDAVVNWWNSFGYFEDKAEDFQMLENIYASLKQRGVLLMDIFGKEISAMNDFDTHWSREEGSLLLQDHEIKENWSKFENTWVKVEEGEVVEFTWQQTLYSAQELRKLLERVGFSEIEFYGNLEQDLYDHDADRMIVKAIK